MRVLFDNIIGDALLGSVHEDSAYPVTNLASPYIRERFQVVGTEDTVTVVFSEDVQIADLFWGYTTVERMVFTFKDASDNVVDMVYFEGGSVAHYYGYEGGYYGYDDHYYGYYDRTTDHLYDPVAWHFDAITVRSITIEMEGPEDFYLGALALGVAYAFPDPQASWLESWDDKSLRSESQGGHVLQQYVEPMRRYTFPFAGVSREQANEIRTLYKSAGVGKRVWVDPFENNHDFMEPLYASITAPIETRKDGNTYSFELAVKEAR